MRPDPDARSLAERVQGLVEAPVAAGLHSIAAASLAAEPPDEDALVCGDDPRAKELGLALAAKLVAGRALDAGPLASARTLEGLTAVIVNLNRRYKAHAGVRVTGIAMIAIVPVEGLPEIEAGDDLAALIAAARVARGRRRGRGRAEGGLEGRGPCRADRGRGAVGACARARRPPRPARGRGRPP